jgi:phenylpyruvate tautomerase PptA (4-oxalocrotonate tautomerase family)
MTDVEDSKETLCARLVSRTPTTHVAPPRAATDLIGGGETVPMIDVYAAAGMFSDMHTLARRLAAEVMAVERVPDIPMFRQNTAAYIHEWPTSAFANVDGDSNYVRVQVLTTSGALSREQQIELVTRLTALITEAPGHPPRDDQVWVMLTEAPDGGWGLWGHAHTNAEIVFLARTFVAGADDPQAGR